MEYLYLFLMVLGSAGQSLFSKLYADKSNIDKENSPQVFNFVYSLLITLITLVIAGFQFHPSGLTWLFASVAAVCSTLFNISVVKASQLGPYPVYTVSLLFGGIIVPVIGEMLTVKGKILGLTDCIGIVIMLAAIVLMTYTKDEKKKLSKQFIVHCIILFFVNGIFCLMTSFQGSMLASTGGEKTEFIVIAYAISAILSLAFIIIRNRTHTLEKLKLKPLPALYALLSAGAATTSRYMTLLCVPALGASVVFPVDNGGVMVLVALFSFIIFREKQTKIQILGDVLACASIVLLSV